MKKRIVAVTMAVVTGLGLGCPLGAAAQTSGAAQRDDDLSAILQTEESKGTGQPSETAPSETAAPPTTIPVSQQEPASAPTMPQPDNKVARQIEEVVVTARRTAENLQDVPVAISAMSGADLAREQINSGQDLQGRVPSLAIAAGNQLRNTETPTIRGQGATYSASPGVVIYFAEVPLPADSIGNGQGGPGKFFDLANLQVLKGSQGTLFGRNTTGGALLLEPHKPENNLSASMRTEGSSYAGAGYEGVLNVPVVNDTLLLRVGGKYFEREGFTRDVVTGKDYDSKGYWTARLGLTWKPTDGIDNYLLSYFTRNHDNGGSYVIEAMNSEGFNRAIMTLAGLTPPPGVPPEQQAGCQYFNANAPSTNCGQDIVAEQQARGIRRVQLSADPNDILETGGAINHFNLTLTDQLTLRNIASYSFFQHHYRWDQDGSRAAIDDFHSPDSSNASDTGVYTEELQLQGTALNDKLKFVGGGYYEYLKPQGPQENLVTAIFSPFNQEFALTRRSYGPYAQGTYDMGGLSEALEGLNVTAGARYSFDEINGTAAINGAKFGAEISDSAPTWTVGADYKVQATLLYGKISRGYKTGGFSAVAVNPANYTFKPEFVTNYEIGQKSDFEIGDAPARVNAALYYTDYTDMQRTGGDSYLAPNSPPPPQLGVATFNAGKARIAGLEIDATVQPFSRLTLMATYGYTYAKYKEFEVLAGTLTPQLDCTGQGIARGGIAQLKCLPFQFAPKNQYSASARYHLPVDVDLGEIEGSLTYVWIDRQYSSPITIPAAEPKAWLNSYGLLNASLRWGRIFGSALDLQLYGTNLTDEIYRLGNSNVWNLLYMQSSIYGEPRVIGLQLGYSWGD